MSGMDQFLAEYYGTGSSTGTAVEATTDAGNDKLAAAASAELFAKMAAAEGIDLDSLTDAQVEELYTNTFSEQQKTAGEMPPQFAKKDGEEKEEPKDEKKEKAKEEHEEKKAEATKVAEADFLGRVMAHAYVQELNKIAEAAAAAETVQAPAEETKEAAKGGNFGAFLKSVQKKGKDAAGAVKGKAEEAVDKVKETAKKHPKATTALAGGAGAAAGATAAMALKGKGKEKGASATDELAAELAVEKAAAAGWNAEEAAQRIAAIMILGPSDEGSKVAAAENVEQAIDIRASELLEMAGYPVTWG